jgi:transposase
MVLPIPDLPDDVNALKAMISAMAEERAANEARLVAAQAEITRLEAVEKSANERIANLTSILKVLQRTRRFVRRNWLLSFVARSRGDQCDR